MARIWTSACAAILLVAAAPLASAEEDCREVAKPQRSAEAGPTSPDPRIPEKPSSEQEPIMPRAGAEGGSSASAGAGEPPPQASPEAKVDDLVEDGKVDAEGTKHAEGGPAEPREQWFTPCPQGQEANKAGDCVAADLPAEKPPCKT